MTDKTAVDVLYEAAALKELKSKDYQGGKWKEEDYFPFGHQSYIHMLWTKILRIRNIAEGDQETNFESLEDSLKDLSVYSAMYAAWVMNEKAYQERMKRYSDEDHDDNPLYDLYLDIGAGGLTDDEKEAVGLF